MDEKKKDLDFSGIYNFDPTYIHSNIKNFEGGIKKAENPDRTLQIILDEIKEEIFKEVKAQYDYFVKIEEELVKKLQKKDSKFAPQTREEFIERYKKLNDLFQEEDAYAYNIVQIKTTLKTGRLNEQVKKAVESVINQILGTKGVKLPSVKKKGTPQEIAESVKAEKEFREEVLRKSKLLQIDIIKEVEKKLLKRKEEVKKIVKEIKKPLNHLLNYVAKQLSVHYEDTENSKEKTAIITSYQKFIEMILSLMKDNKIVDWKKDYQSVLDSLPKTEDDFSSMLSNQSNENIIRHLTIMKNFTFYDDLIQNFQFSQLTGNMFEIIVKDTIHQAIEKEVSEGIWKEVGSLFLETDQVNLGINSTINYEKVTTIDLETHEIEYNKTPIFFGSSLKLKEGNQSIDLNNSPVERYLKNLEQNISKEDFRKMDYIRKNVTALNIFAEDEDKFSETIKTFFDSYDEFEKEVIYLAMVVRFLIGFVRKQIEDNQTKYLGIDMEKGSEYGEVLNSLYLNNFIITQSHIYSTVDILYFILDSLGEGKKWDSLGIQMKLSDRKNFSSTKDQLITLSNFKKRIDTGNVQNYEKLIQNGEIKSILEDLSKIFGVSSYSTATMAMDSKSLSKMKK